MTARNSVLVRLGISLLVLSGAAYYALIGSEERAVARKMEYLARKVLVSTRDGTPLHERALSLENRASIASLRDLLTGPFKLVAQGEKDDAWEFGYCFDGEIYALLSLPMDRSAPTLKIVQNSKCPGPG